jgi:hypothetical protein
MMAPKSCCDGFEARVYCASPRQQLAQPFSAAISLTVNKENAGHAMLPSALYVERAAFMPWNLDYDSQGRKGRDTW